MTIFEKIWYYEPCSCLKCGSFIVNDSQFCKFCFLEFYQPGESLYRRNDPVETFYLFNWIPQDSDSLSFLLRHLKGSQKKSAWKYYAKIFWREMYLHCMEDLQDQEIILIPSPAKSLIAPDHAEIFCQNLSEISGFPMFKALQRIDPTEQKNRRKKDRSQDRFKLRENFSADLWAGKKLIFVDDIVTTGGTALAAKSALCAENISVWALASRAFGCDQS